VQRPQTQAPTSRLLLGSREQFGGFPSGARMSVDCVGRRNCVLFASGRESSSTVACVIAGASRIADGISSEPGSGHVTLLACNIAFVARDGVTRLGAGDSTIDFAGDNEEHIYRYLFSLYPAMQPTWSASLQEVRTKQ
jgi:hypothetical protein